MYPINKACNKNIIFKRVGKKGKAGKKFSQSFHHSICISWQIFIYRISSYSFLYVECVQCVIINKSDEILASWW